MKIITGKTGVEHVTGADDAAFNMGIVGDGDYVLSNTVLTVTQPSANRIQLGKAEIVMQGIHGRMDGTDIVTITDGTQGMYRVDSVVAFWEASASTGYETMGLKVLKGTPAAQQASAQTPTINKGDTYNGATYREMELLRVNLYESTIQNIDVVANVLPNIKDIGEIVREIRNRMNRWIPMNKVTATGKNEIIGRFDLENDKTYLLIAQASFAGNSNGRRSICVSRDGSANSWTPMSNLWVSDMNANAASIRMLLAVQNIVSTGGTYYVKTYQNSGNAISVDGGATVIEL